MVPNSLGRELSCSQWEGPRMHSRCLAFFPLKWGWGGGGGGGVRKIFFIFPWSPMYSHYVPFKFSMGSIRFPRCSSSSQCIPTMLYLSSQWVPIRFPICSQSSQCVLQLNMFSIAAHFYPICFGKCCPPFTHIDQPKGRNCILQI
jgi:hypothetical protein